MNKHILRSQHPTSILLDYITSTINFSQIVRRIEKSLKIVKSMKLEERKRLKLMLREMKKN